MFNKRLIGGCLTVLICLLVLLPGTGLAKMKLKLGHPGALNHHYHEGALMFKDLVASKSNGEMEIVVFPANQLGKQRQLVEGAQLGTVEMVLTSDVLLSSFEKSMGVLNLPYIFNDIDHVSKVLDGEIGSYLSDKLSKKGLVVLGYWENGFRHVSNSKRPINTPEDLKGLKIRTPGGFVFVDTFNSYGASATPMSFGELYSALQLKTVDGQENPVAHVLTQKFFEVQKYLSLTSHIHVSEPLVMSKVIFESLDPKQQQILDEAAKEVAAWMRHEVQSLEDSQLEMLKGKIEVNDADRTAFKAASTAVYEKHSDKFGELIKRIQNAK